MTEATVAASCAGSWEELVTTALLGTERRGIPAGTAGPGDPVADPSRAEAGLEATTDLVDRSDAALALLDLAAVHTVHRRASLRPGRAEELPAPAPEDPRPVLPPAAGRRLAMLLTDRSGPGSGPRGTAPNLAELLPQWLRAARERGYRAPCSLLPALLEAARGRSDLRPDALALAGPRGLWLAALNPDWKFALRFAAQAGGAAGAGAGGAAAPGLTADERRVWEEGLFAERVALLSRVRRRDPAEALALLRPTWSAERAEERLIFLDTLREGLGPQDESFLEEALADRSKNVRSTAAELLSALPGSAFSARMAERAAACVSLEHTGTGPRLVVTAPAECDTAMQRDGVLPKPPAGRGKRAWWLSQLVEAAPLALWTERFGLSPAEIVALPVAEGWREDLHDAWGKAAVRQRNAVWARALLGSPPPAPLRSAGPVDGPFTATPAGTSKDPVRLLSVLPEEERASWVAGFVRAHGLAESFQLLGACSVPWSPQLGEAVLDALDIARDAGSYPWSFSGVMGLAERCLDPAQADRVDALTATPVRDSAPGAGTYWSEAFQRLADTLRLRAAMLTELDGPQEP